MSGRPDLADQFINHELVVAQLQERIQSLEAELQRAKEMKTCGCGDIRPLLEFCHLCGECQMGCCMCVSRKEVDRLTAKLKIVTDIIRSAFHRNHKNEVMVCTNAYHNETADRADRYLAEIEKPCPPLPKTRNALGRWMEEFKHCGCTYVAQKRSELMGYCPKHANDRRRIHPKLPAPGTEVGHAGNG